MVNGRGEDPLPISWLFLIIGFGFRWWGISNTFGLSQPTLTKCGLTENKAKRCLLDKQPFFILHYQFEGSSSALGWLPGLCNPLILLYPDWSYRVNFFGIVVNKPSVSLHILPISKLSSNHRANLPLPRIALFNIETINCNPIKKEDAHTLILCF